MKWLLATALTFCLWANIANATDAGTWATPGGGTCNVNFTLSGTGNRIATSGSATDINCNGANSWLLDGKGYIEFTVAGYTSGNNDRVGITDSTMSFEIACTKSGVIVTNIGNSGSTCPTFVSTNIVFVAIDMPNKLIWFSNSAHVGTWNAGSGASPGGTGGFNFTTAGECTIAVACIIRVDVNDTGSATTANTGTSAFTGTVPSGFTALNSIINGLLGDNFPMKGCCWN